MPKVTWHFSFFHDYFVLQTLYVLPSPSNFHVDTITSSPITALTSFPPHQTHIRSILPSLHLPASHSANTRVFQLHDQTGVVSVYYTFRCESLMD